MQRQLRLGHRRDGTRDHFCRRAVQLRERSGKVVAAISFASNRSRRTPVDLTNNVLPHLQALARQMESTTGSYRDQGQLNPPARRPTPSHLKVYRATADTLGQSLQKTQ